MAHRKLPPVHPGEILLEEFLSPLGVSQYRLAKDTSVPARRIRILNSAPWSFDHCPSPFPSPSVLTPCSIRGHQSLRYFDLASLLGLSLSTAFSSFKISKNDKVSPRCVVKAPSSPTKFTLLRAVILLGFLIWILVRCSRMPMPEDKVVPFMMAEITNQLKLPWPEGFTNIAATCYQYHTITEGSTTLICLCLQRTDSAGMLKLQSMLESNKIGMAKMKQIPGGSEAQHAEWWHPGGQDCIVFQMSAEIQTSFKLLAGYITQDSPAPSIYLELHILTK